MILTNLFKKKDIPFYLFVALIYLYNIRSIAFPKNFQQDDISELFIEKYYELSCVINAGDNHPLWTFTIWLISRLNKFEYTYVISSINILVTLLSTLIFYSLMKKEFNNLTALFSSFLLLTSPTLLTYSVGLKQYSFEFIYSVFLLCMVCLYKNDLSKIIFDIKFYVISFFLIMMSLANLITFAVLFLLSCLTYMNQSKKINFKFLLFLPLFIPFSLRAFSKVNRSSFNDYWDDFFLDISSFDSFTQSVIFLYSLFLKNILGFTWNKYIVLIISILFVIGSFTRNKINNFCTLVLMFFVILNILNFYPIGGNRTDIIFLIFFIYLVASGFDKISVFNNFTYVLIFTIVIYSHLFVKPFYKTETISPLINEISKEFDNNSDSIFVSYEQKNSFDYYGKDYFETANFKRQDNNCNYNQLNIKNYFVFDPLKESRYKQNFQQVKENSEKVYLVGIELDGTVGFFRTVEKDLIENGFRLKESIIYPIGIYLNIYELTNYEN